MLEGQKIGPDELDRNLESYATIVKINDKYSIKHWIDRVGLISFQVIKYQPHSKKNKEKIVYNTKISYNSLENKIQETVDQFN